MNAAVNIDNTKRNAEQLKSYVFSEKFYAIALDKSNELYLCKSFNIFPLWFRYWRVTVAVSRFHVPFHRSRPSASLQRMVFCFLFREYKAAARGVVGGVQTSTVLSCNARNSVAISRFIIVVTRRYISSVWFTLVFRQPTRSRPICHELNILIHAFILSDGVREARFTRHKAKAHVVALLC